MNFIKSVRFSVLSLIILITSICVPVMAATPSQIEEAKQQGVAWLATQQTLPEGYWSDAGYRAGPTGLTLVALEERAFELGYTPFDPSYPYKENVESGLAYLFSQMGIISISTQPAGNPDTDGDGNGVYVGSTKSYETGIAMMAIAASRAPDRVVDVPGSPVDGWTYRDVLVDMVDYMAFGQCDSSTGRGGWRYSHYDNAGGTADNSISGYAVSGLGFAESPRCGFNCTIPQFVKDELKLWIDYIQNDSGDDYYDGGSGYDSPGYWVNILKTGNLVFQMTFAGIVPQDPNFQRALAYIGRKWNDPSRNPGWGNPAYLGTPHYQAVYCTSNGLWFSNINSIIVDDIQRDWYADFADALVNAQQPAGNWPTDLYGGTILATDWALLTLWKPVGRSMDMQDYMDTLFSGSFNSTLSDLRVTEDEGGDITSFSSDSTDFGAGGNIWELEVFNNELYMCIGDTLYNPDVTVSGEDVSVSLGDPIWTVPDGDDIISMLNIDSMLLIGTGIEASTNSSYDSHTGDIYTYDGSIFEPDGVVGSGVQCLISAPATCEPEYLTMLITAYAEDAGGWVDANENCVSPEDFDADEIKYEITIDPNGQTDAQGFVLTVMLPDNVDFISADDCGAYDESSRAVVWLLDDIAPEADPVTRTLIVRVNSSSVPDQTITTVYSLENEHFQLIANDNTPKVCCWGSGILYVDKSHTTGLRNGRSWETALDSLSSALNYAAASDCYSEIWVAAGTYIPQGTDPAETFIMPDGISIYGGFKGTEEALNERDFRSASNETILSGAGLHDYVVTIEGVSTIDGFSVQGGVKAGILCDSASPTISHCYIGGNGSGTAGDAGIHLSDTSAEEMLNCVIYSNSGDGIYIDGTASPFIRNNTIADNTAYGINNNGSGTPSVYNCLLWGNTGGQQAGCTTHYCYIQGLSGTKDGNFNFGGAYPFDPVRAYHLASDANCIDEGLDELTGVWTIGSDETDIDGEARIVGDDVDIGADEFPPLWVDAGDTIFEEIPVGASTVQVDFTSASVLSNGGVDVPTNLSYQWHCIYYPDGYEPVFVDGTDSELYASATFSTESWYLFLLEVMDVNNDSVVVGADLLWVRIDMGVEIVVDGKDPVSEVSDERTYEAYVGDSLDLNAMFGPPAGPDHVEWWAPYEPVSIGDPTQVSTTISFDTPGRYPLELYALNVGNKVIGKDRVWIEVRYPQIEVSAGPDRILYLEKNLLEVWEVSDQFHGSVDGINITSADRVEWSVEAADDNADLSAVSVVSDPMSPKVANITFGHYGAYYVLFSAWKNTAQGEVFLGTGAAITIVTYQQVEMDAGTYPDVPDVNVVSAPATFNLQGEVTQGQVDSIEWVFTDPEAPAGLVTFASPNSLSTMVTFNEVGGYSGAGTYPITLLGKINIDGEDWIVGANTVEITVEVTGGDGDDFTKTICISTGNSGITSSVLPLTAQVWATIEEGPCGSEIPFEDYDYAVWSWSGTDGSVIIDQPDQGVPEADVTFNRAGDYILTLVVKNGESLVVTTSHPIKINKVSISAEAGFNSERTEKVLENIAIGSPIDIYGQVSSDCLETQIEHYWSCGGSSDAVDLNPVDINLPDVNATVTFSEPGDYPLTLCVVNAQTRELLAFETILASVAPPLFWLDISGARITAPQEFPVDLPLTAEILGGAPTGSTCTWSAAEPGGIPPVPAGPVDSGTTVTYSFTSVGTYELTVTGNVSDPVWSQTVTVTVYVSEVITEMIWNAGSTKYVTLPEPAYMSDAVFVTNDPNFVPKWSLDNGPADITFLPNENSENPYVVFSEEGQYTLSLVPWDLRTQEQKPDTEASEVYVFVDAPIVPNPDSPEVTLDIEDGPSDNLKVLTATANDKDGISQLLLKLGDELLASASGAPVYNQELTLDYTLDISHLPVGTSYVRAYAWDTTGNLGQSDQKIISNTTEIANFDVEPKTVSDLTGPEVVFTASLSDQLITWTLEVFNKATGAMMDSKTGQGNLTQADPEGDNTFDTTGWADGNYQGILTAAGGSTGKVDFRIWRDPISSSEVIADMNSFVGTNSGNIPLDDDFAIEDFIGGPGGVGFESPLPIIEDGQGKVFAMLGNADFPDDVKYRLRVCTVGSGNLLIPIQVITPSAVPHDAQGWARISSRGDSVEDLGTIDLSMLDNGTYYMELSVWCNGTTVNDYVQFILDCPLKVGNVKFSQEDLVIETGGIPLRVVRTYDSFQKHEDGEFGYGWTYSIADMDVELQESRLDVEVLYGSWSDSIRYDSPYSRNVSLTLPNGQKTTFMFYLECYGNIGYVAKYAAQDGINYTLSTEKIEKLLFIPFSKMVYWERQGLGSSYNMSTYEFSGYILTNEEDGTQYYIERSCMGGDYYDIYDEETGSPLYVEPYGKPYLTRIRTINGEEINLNTSLYTGQIGASGDIECVDAQGTVTKSLEIEYNSSGRIWYINAPSEAGQIPGSGTPTLVYEYDEDNGNLTRVKRLANKNGTTEDEKYDITEYAYDDRTHNPDDHYVTDIIDERGLTPIRYVYDAAGRLIETIDAKGNSIIIQHGAIADNGDKAEVVYERWDTEQLYPTVYAYNDRGNVTLVQKNEVGKTDPLEETLYFYEDPLYLDGPSRIEKWVPDPADPTQSVVAETRYEYDEHGKTTLTIDPLGNATIITGYDLYGNVLEIIQAKNYVNSTTYDTVSITRNTYEGNKLKTTEIQDATYARLQMTVNIYDGRNRIVKTINLDVDVVSNFEPFYTLQDGDTIPNETDHAITTYSYADIDPVYPLQPEWIEDPSGARTSFEYDQNGRQKYSYYKWIDPEGIQDLYVFTKNTYDDQGRVTKTERIVDVDTDPAGVEPETVLSETKYNSLDKVDFTIDQYNNVTKYEYDQVGNLVETRTLTTAAYDIGIDPQGRIVEYDSDGTAVQTHDYFAYFEADADTSHLTTTRTLYDTEGRAWLTVGPYDPAVYDEVPSEWPVGSETVYDVMGRVVETRRWAGVIVDLVPFKVESSGQPVPCQPDDTEMVGKMVPPGVYPEHAWDESSTQPTGIGWTSNDKIPVIDTETYSVDEHELPISYTRTVYDIGGRVKHSLTLDENGDEQVTTYYYDKAGKQTRVVDPQGHQNLTHVARGDTGFREIQEIALDTFDDTEVTGNLTGTHKTVTLYDGTRRSSVTDARGNMTSFQYDALGRLEKTTHPEADYHDGTYQTFTYTGYDGLGRKEWQTEPTANTGTLGDADGLRWFDYDAVGRLTQVTLPKPKATDPNPVYRYIYDDYGNQVGILDAEDRLTVFEYDELNHRTAKYMPFVPTDPAPGDIDTAEEVYTALSNADPAPDAEYRDYDEFGRLEAHTDYKEQTTGYFYNNLGQLQYKRYYNSYSAYESDPEAGWAEQVEYTYDNLGRRTTVEEKDNPNTYTRTTTYHYDAQGRVVQVDTPQGTINYEYNSVTGRKVRTYTDSTGGADTSYSYDELGRLATAGSTQYSYDFVGNRQSVTLPNGVYTYYWYNALNRLTKQVHFDEYEPTPDTPSVAGTVSSFAYGPYADGMRKTADEVLNENRYLDYSYDNLNRLTTEQSYDDPGFNPSSDYGYTADYTYDLVGNRLTREIDVTRDDGYGGYVTYTITTTYDYDDNTDRLETETHVSDEPIAAIMWDENKPVYAYAPGGQINYQLPGGSGRIGQFKAFFLGLPSAWNQYLLFAVLFLVPVLFLLPVIVRFLRRLAKALSDQSNLRLSLYHRCMSVLLAYVMLISPVGLQSLAQGATAYSEISTLAWGQDGDVFTYYYDANGSMEYKLYDAFDPAADPAVIISSNPTLPYDHYEYNLQNRLKKVTSFDGLTSTWAQYTYNDAGIRVKAEHSDTTVEIFLIDAYNHTGYAQVLEEKDASSAVTKTYTIGDDVIAQYNTTDGTEYLLYDGHGSTRQLTDSAGAVVDSYSYDGYGVMLGTDDTAAANADTSLLYAGEQYDSSLDQYYLRARYYNPSNGLFNRADPFAGSPQDPQSLHRYLYAHCNPINSIDPTGNFEFSITGMLQSMAINSIVANICMPVIAPLINEVGIRLIGSSWLQGIPAVARVSGYILGGGGTGNVPKYSLPFGIAVNVEAVKGRNTGNWAAFVGLGVSSNRTWSVAGYVGLVFNCSSSGNYKGGTVSVTVAYSKLPSKVRESIKTWFEKSAQAMLSGISHPEAGISEITRYIKPSDVTQATNFLISRSLEKSSITLFGSPESGSYGFTINPGILSWSQEGTQSIQIALQMFGQFYPWGRSVDF